MAYNKFITKNGEVMLDLTGDSATAADVLAGKTFHLPNGEQAQGTAEFSSGGDSCFVTVTPKAILGITCRNIINMSSQNVTTNVTAEVN